LRKILIQIQSIVSIENMEPGICILLLTFLFSTVVADAASADSTMDAPRDPKLSIFQVVKFTNSHCTGTSKNGTCFTRQECDNIGGTQDGTCADGFGVCCTVTLTTGGSSSVNNSYIQVTSTTNLDLGTNKYTICPCSDDICRIKFDFESFDIQGPSSGFNYVGGGTKSTVIEQANFANDVGQCSIDSFQILSPSGRASPLICGDNDNQHMILDVSDNECLTVDLGIGTTTTSTTRELDIRIMQYRCGEEAGGPPGCLQYFENTSGKIRSFNFPDASPGTTIAAGYATHLANQHYSACVRQGAGKEVICYIPCTTTDGEGAIQVAPTSQPSFGLSIGAASEVNAEGAQHTECSTDYIWIPNGIKYDQFTTAISQQDSPLEGFTGTLQANRYCGRYFQTVSETIWAAAEPSSICSYVTPFVLGVDFDNNEVCETEAQGTLPEECEGIGGNVANMAGGSGALGFSLCYVQHTPPI